MKHRFGKGDTVSNRDNPARSSDRTALVRKSAQVGYLQVYCRVPAIGSKRRVCRHSARAAEQRRNIAAVNAALWVVDTAIRLAFEYNATTFDFNQIEAQRLANRGLDIPRKHGLQLLEPIRASVSFVLFTTVRGRGALPPRRTRRPSVGARDGRLPPRSTPAR